MRPSPAPLATSSKPLKSSQNFDWTSCPTVIPITQRTRAGSILLTCSIPSSTQHPHGLHRRAIALGPPASSRRSYRGMPRSAVRRQGTVPAPPQRILLKSLNTGCCSQCFRGVGLRNRVIRVGKQEGGSWEGGAMTQELSCNSSCATSEENPALGIPSAMLPH